MTSSAAYHTSPVTQQLVVNTRTGKLARSMEIEMVQGYGRQFQVGDTNVHIVKRHKLDSIAQYNANA